MLQYEIDALTEAFDAMIANIDQYNIDLADAERVAADTLQQLKIED